MSLKETDNLPEYIKIFINGNIDNLNNIYSEGINISGPGILVCKCSEKDNRIDIQFMDKEMIEGSFPKEIIEMILSDNLFDNKSLFIEDMDLSSHFIITL